MMKVVALAGGVGGAKLAYGLAEIIAPQNFTVIVNTGDDFEHFGLKICPDLDTVCYTLANISNPDSGWGRSDETWNAIDGITLLGGPGWFRLGDRDLGTHLERTRRLRLGEKLSQITQDFCKSWGICSTVLPMSDDPVPTIVITRDGDLPFQEYFVHRRCEPSVKGFHFPGSGQASPAPGVISAINHANILIICPSNPWVSIDPILNVPTIKETILRRKENGLKVLAVSPIVGGKAIKGPLAKMYLEMGLEPSAIAVAEHYSDLLDLFVLDVIDMEYAEAVKLLKVSPLCLNTIMKSYEERKKLATEIVSHLSSI